MTTTPTDLPNGYYVLQPGRLANAVIWLEMRAPPKEPLAPPLRLVVATPDDGATCARLFTEVGTPWLGGAEPPARPVLTWRTPISQSTTRAGRSDW